MIQAYKNVSIIYGGHGRKYADALNERILKLSEEKRYPIKPTIINERILTCELLAEVTSLFKGSEFCVAFLTEDDFSINKDGGKTQRLRQNVVFELGMALIEIGRERCILLSDFDPNKADFELPSDMHSLEIKRFDEDSFDSVCGSVIEKLLSFSKSSINYGTTSDDIPCYNNLFRRDEYLIDYENIFSNRPDSLATEGWDFYKDTLKYWEEECEALPNYDEKCIHILERIGFLPIFGKTRAAADYLSKVDALTDNYHRSDIRYYGDAGILEFARNLVSCVAAYTNAKTVDIGDQERLSRFKKIRRDLSSERAEEHKDINPLMAVVYYDYLGLLYLRLYGYEKKSEDLQKALDCFLEASKLTSKVDMALQIWSGFLTYNIARVYAEKGEVEESEAYYNKAIRIRGAWLKNSRYNITVRNALSYEYFIARISYLDMCKKYGIKSDEELKTDYTDVERELDMYSENDEQAGQLFNIRKMLVKRMTDT